MPVALQSDIVCCLGAREIASLEDMVHGAGNAPLFWQHCVAPLRQLLGAYMVVSARHVRSLLLTGLPPQVLDQLGDDARRKLVHYLRSFAEDTTLVEQLCVRRMLCAEVAQAAYDAYNLTSTWVRKRSAPGSVAAPLQTLAFAARMFSRHAKRENNVADAHLAFHVQTLHDQLLRLEAHESKAVEQRPKTLTERFVCAQEVVGLADLFVSLADAARYDEHLVARDAAG